MQDLRGDSRVIVRVGGVNKLEWLAFQPGVLYLCDRAALCMMFTFFDCRAQWQVEEAAAIILL